MPPNFLLPQHEVIDSICLYVAYQGSTTNGSPNEYYVNLKSVLGLTKTSVYLVEMAISDLFLVGLSNKFLSTRVMLI